ncbi:MAG: thermonuclease family protein [Dysgonomonas sp.]|nr:thermonuclease family protein [Dysgonomonas sp.]
MKILILLCLLSFQSDTVLTGLLVRITDGDSVVLLTEDKQQIKVRLDGIDCPELGQPFSQKAKQFVGDICKDKEIKVHVTGKDRYKRTLGVLYADTINVNEALLSAGLAWQYKFNKSADYAELEQEAKVKKLNIWSESNPVAPWDYRKSKKKK